MASDIATYLKFANVQMAAEALFTSKNAVPGATYSGAVLPAVLATGNERSSKFSDAQAAEFARD